MSNKNIKQVIEDKIIIEEMRFSCKAVCVSLFTAGLLRHATRE